MREAFTTRRLFELILVLGVFAMAIRGVGDPDFWWHLRTGQEIMVTHSIPHSDSYSHTMHGAPWIAHEWLSEVLIYGIYRAGGYLGLIVTFAICVALAFWLALLRSSGRPYIAGLALLLGAIATIPFWGVRPQMFSLLLTSVFLYLLDRFDGTGNPVVLWWMPPLIALWVNLHGGFAIGIALIAVAIVCRLVEAAWSPDLRRENLVGAKSLTFVMAASVLAVVLNPNGVRMYTYPFETLGSSSIQGYIQEWASPNFHTPRMQPFALLLIITFTALIAVRNRPRLRPFVLLVVAAYAALRSSRHIPLFALVAIPVLADALQSFFVSRNWLRDLRAADARPQRTALNYCIAIAFVSFCLVRVHTVAGKQQSVDTKELPVRAVEYIRQQHPPAPIFNSYEWGGYLIWTLYPEYHVFVDGRSDMYGDQFLDEFVRTYKASNDWRKVLHRFGIRTVLLPINSPLALALREEPGWNIAFQDSLSVVMTTGEPQCDKLVQVTSVHY